MGVVAIGPIAKGEVVLSEAPLFTQQLGWNMLTIVQSLVLKTADEKRQFLELTNCHQRKLRGRPLINLFHRQQVSWATLGGMTICRSGSHLMKFRIPMQHSRYDTGPGFSQGASNVDASHRTFNQYNYNNAMNDEMVVR